MFASDNQLSGSIPAELGDLSQLTELILSDNQLSGEIPAELGTLNQLIQLYLQRNQLTGSIPMEIGNLSQLLDLTMYENQLTGTIPAALGNLSELVFLYLNDNQFSGSIPEELSSLSQLSVLWLNDNQLSGCIPFSFQTFCSGINVDLSSNPLLDNDEFTSYCETSNGSCPVTISFNIKVYLQGPFLSETGLMNDFIRIQEIFPQQSPYGGLEEINDPNILLINDNNAIVDWIEVELRDGDDPTSIVQTKSGLLQKDGDIVSSVDGVSLLTFEGLFDNDSILVGINHRNHLGVRNLTPIILSGDNNSIALDFSDLTLNVLGGNNAAANLGGIRALLSGDANNDGQINANDKNNFWRPANGESFEYFFSSGDFNLDGVVNAADKNFHWRVNNGKASYLD